MKAENQRPNPVEDYLRKIINEDSRAPDGKIKFADSATKSKNGPKQSPITEEAFKQRKPVFDPTGRIEQITDAEVKVADVRRHPFGLIVLYVEFIVATGLAIGLLAFLLPAALGANVEGANLFIGLLVLLMSILALVFLVLATRIYRGNQLIITDQNVTQVQQISLFNRKVSELTMANIEDVTSNTNGIFATLFNFGTITVETAGEQNNFVFKYCPNPNAYAKALQDARSNFIRQHRSSH
ncbi:MAG TPA: PH domain-containing protein [Patescibacteria group bacterium]|nr:PH domain-containing protein [Patescibacteria group bacterium]